jgi:hypothetical protein
VEHDEFREHREHGEQGDFLLTVTNNEVSRKTIVARAKKVNLSPVSYLLYRSFVNVNTIAVQH